MVHHGFGVVNSDHTLGCLLHALRSVPGIVNIFGWETPQNGQIAPERGGARSADCMHTHTHPRHMTKLLRTVCNLRWGPCVGRTRRGSNSERTAGKKSCRRATSSCQRSRSSLRPAAAPQTPTDTEDGD